MDQNLAVIVGVGFGWLFSLCFHEWSHSIVAYHGGDTGVAGRGYLSWNPLNYVHPIMSILLPMVLLFLGGIALPGGAVYIDRSQVRSRGWDTAISLAGPAANLVFGVFLGLCWLVLGRGEDLGHPSVGAVVLGFLTYVQFMAFLLNLLPIPPLDGWGAIRPWLPEPVQEMGDQAGWTGIILILFIFTVPGIGVRLLELLYFVGWGVFGIPEPYLHFGFRAFRLGG